MGKVILGIIDRSHSLVIPSIRISGLAVSRLICYELGMDEVRGD